MSDMIGIMPSVLPDILAAAGLILLGIVFCGKRARYRAEEERLWEAIRSLREETEQKRDGKEPGQMCPVRQDRDKDANAESENAAEEHSGKGDL